MQVVGCRSLASKWQLMGTGLCWRWIILKHAFRYSHGSSDNRSIADRHTSETGLAATIEPHARQPAHFPLQTMQTRGAQEHQNNVTYSIMDVTALQLEV